MDSTGYLIFPTLIGTCAIIWRGEKIIGVQIAEDDSKQARLNLLERFANASALKTPFFVTKAVDKIHALLSGSQIDFSNTPLALDNLPDLHRQVYQIILKIPPGQTTTYGAIARTIGDIHLSQAVGYALGKNPFPIIVPCHRVLGTGGKIGGFSAHGGTLTKIRLLNIEQAQTSAEPGLFDSLPLQQPPAPH